MQIQKFCGIVTASFLHNVNYGNDNSFPQHFFLNIIVSKSFFFFLVTLFSVGFFYPQLTLRQLIQPDLQSRFHVRSQLDTSIQSGSSLITGGHTIQPPIEGQLPPTGIEPTSFRNSPPKQLDYRCMPLHPGTPTTHRYMPL